MQIRVSSRATKLTDRDREFVTEKVDRLARFLPGMDHAEVHFTEEKNPRIVDKQVCEVTLSGHGKHVRCRTNGPDLLTAVDRAVEKLENKLHRIKGRLNNHRSEKERAAARKLTESADQALVEGRVQPPLLADGEGVDVLTAGMEALAGGYEIVRSKRVEKLTLSPVEAALRMDLVGHPFYVFTNAQTGQSAVVYRRDDGTVGLIDQGDGAD